MPLNLKPKNLPRNVARSLSPLRSGRGGGSRSKSPLKSKKKRAVLRTVSADRDRAYFNILGTEGLVGSGHVLQEIELTRTTASITKLEMEDIVCRKANSQEIFCAIQQLLQEDRRPWSKIKFTDTIHVFAEHDSDDDEGSSQSRARSQLIEYETKKRALLELITTESGGSDSCADFLPLSFEVKIMMDEGTSIESVLKLMEVLPNNSSLERLEFGGAALFDCKEEDIPQKLTGLFLKVKALDAKEGTSYRYYTMEHFHLYLYYSAPNLQSDNQQLAVISDCITKLTSLHTGIVPRRHGVIQDMTAMSSKAARTRENPILPKQHDRRRRKDRIKQHSRKSKEDSDELSTGGTTHSRSKSPRRRRIKRQNSLPETDPDKAFVRKNSVELNLEKLVKLKTHARSRKGNVLSQSELEPGKEDPAPTHTNLGRTSRRGRSKMRTQEDDTLGPHSFHGTSNTKGSPPERKRCPKRQNSFPETQPDIMVAQQNTAELQLDKQPTSYPNRIQSTVGVAA